MEPDDLTFRQKLTHFFWAALGCVIVGWMGLSLVASFFDSGDHRPRVGDECKPGHHWGMTSANPMIADLTCLKD